jgi:hypothetical protein
MVMNWHYHLQTIPAGKVSVTGLTVMLVVSLLGHVLLSLVFEAECQRARLAGIGPRIVIQGLHVLLDGVVGEELAGAGVAFPARSLIVGE